MSQSQQHLIMNPEKKPNIISQQQQQNFRGFYSNNSNLHVSQTQSMNFFSPTNRGANQKPNPSSHSASAQRHVNNQYMNKPPPDYQAPMESNNSVQSGSICSRNQMPISISDSINNSGDPIGRNLDQRNSNSVNISQSYNMVSSSEVASHSYPGVIPLNQLYPDLFPPDSNNVSSTRSCSTISSSSVNSNNRRPYTGLSDLISRPCSESPSSETGSTDHRSFPGLIPMNELIPRSCANESLNPNSNGKKPYTGLMPLGDFLPGQDETHPNGSSNAERSFTPISDLISRNNTDLINSNKSVSDCSDRGFPGVISIQELNNTRRPYPGIMPIDESLSLNRGCSTSNANPANVSKAYPSVSFPHTTSVSGAYSSISSISAVPGLTYSQASPHMLGNPTVTSSSSNKGRGKQANSRSNSKQCSSLPRQQKAPNVNVGPEGLNISQRPPPMSNDWRQAYVHSQHQIATNLSDDTYARNGEYSTINNPNVNNFQHVNSNSDNHSLLSMSQNTSQSNTIQDLEGGTTNSLMMQSQSGNFQASQIQISAVSSADINQSNIFSTSSSPSNMQNQFNLDFLDSMDCSASDLLNFDVMQGEGTNFPILDDITILDK